MQNVDYFKQFWSLRAFCELTVRDKEETKENDVVDVEYENFSNKQQTQVGLEIRNMHATTYRMTIKTFARTSEIDEIPCARPETDTSISTARL